MKRLTFSFIYTNENEFLTLETYRYSLTDEFCDSLNFFNLLSITHDTKEKYIGHVKYSAKMVTLFDTKTGDYSYITKVSKTTKVSRRINISLKQYTG